MSNRLTFSVKRFRIRSISQTFTRIRNIHNRFGFSSQKFRPVLFEFARLMADKKVIPTFPVPAVVLRKHFYLFQHLQEYGAELALHGYKHIDYTITDSKEFIRQYRKAISIIDQVGGDSYGNRFPFLSQNPNALNLLAELDFLWDSSRSIVWDVISNENILTSRWNGYKRILQTYNPSSIKKKPSLPYFMGKMVEIPVSLPDDDMLIERLGIDNSMVLFRIWKTMLDDVRKRGELLVLQLHPERFPVFKNALTDLLDEAMADSKGWIAPLCEIARWWKERQETVFSIQSQNRHAFSIHVIGAKRVSLNVKQNQELVKLARNSVIESQTKPIIGILPNSSRELCHFLKVSGYLFETVRRKDRYSLVLDSIYEPFNLNKSGMVLNAIERTRTPLLQFNRWPEEKQWAMAVTGDIDNIDLFDYWGRFYG